MTTDAGPTPSDAAALDALKRIKAAEADWDERLRTARHASAEALERRRADADATVRAVATEAEAERSRAVERARAAAEAEARTIVAEGEATARDAASDKGKRPKDLEKRVLDAVLGPFAPD
ncbi:MAG: hypothetical protein ACLQD9_06305 [Thermoplasmata archaeon]